MKFLIRKSRFVQQIGQAEPVLVSATPENPAIIDIEIPSGRSPDAELFPVTTEMVADDARKRLKPHHADAPRRNIDLDPVGKK